MKKQTLTLLTAFLLVASFLPLVSITSPSEAQEVPNPQINPALDISIPRFRESYEFWSTTAITRRDTGEAIYIYDLADVSVDFSKPRPRAPATQAKIRFSVAPNELTYVVQQLDVGGFNENWYHDGENITENEIKEFRKELGEIVSHTMEGKFIEAGALEDDVSRTIAPANWVESKRSNPITLTIIMFNFPLNPNASWARFRLGSHSLEWVLSSAPDWDSGTHENTASWQEKLRLEWPLTRENYLADSDAIEGAAVASWSPHDPKLIAAVGDYSHTIAVFSYDNVTKALVLENYLSDFTAIWIPEGMSWSPHDPKLIAATGEYSDTIAVFSYDNVTKALVRENYLADETAIDEPWHCDWSPHDPKLIAVAGKTSDTLAVFSYDNVTKALVRENYLADETAIDRPYGVSWSPHDPNLIAVTGAYSDAVAVFSYDNVTKALVRENYLADETAIDYAARVSWSPHDPKLMAVMGWTSDTIAVFSYNSSTKALVRENYLADSTAIGNAIGVSWSPHDPNLIAATGSGPDAIAVFSYDNVTKALVRENYLADPTAIDYAEGVSWSPHDPKLIAVVGWTSDTIAVFFSDGFKSNGEWTSPWDNLGITSSKAWLELKLQTNVPSGCDENITVEVGSGGTPSDSKTFNYTENTGFDGENRIYDISDLTHDEEVCIEFEFSSGSASPEVDLVAVTASPVNVAPEVLNSYTPSTVDPNTAFDVKVEVRDNDDISDIEEVWLKVYENTKSQGDADSARDHYTFKWVRAGADNWFEVGPDSTSPYDHLVVASCVAGDDAENTDNFTFNIKLGVTASPNNKWSVWVKVVDNAGAQDSQEFANKFDVNEYMSLSIDDATLTFSGDPGEAGKAASENPTVCTVDANINFNVQVKLSGDWSGAAFGGSIPMASTHADQNGISPWDLNLSAAYENIWSSVGYGEGVEKNVYWFLDFPLPLRDDVYSTTFYVNVVKA